MATNDGPNLLSKREPRVVVAQTSLDAFESYQLCRTICNTEGWYGRVVPAWAKGTAPSEHRYWIKCCRHKKHPISKWYYIGSEQEWNEVRELLGTSPQLASSANDQPSTSSATEIPSSAPATGTPEASWDARLKSSKSRQSSLKGSASHE